MKVQIRLWYQDVCSLYAVERDDVLVVEDFLWFLETEYSKLAEQLSRFIFMLVRDFGISPLMLRVERPELGVYAMYNHRYTAWSSKYCASRLLCSFIGDSDRILLVGAGFVKIKEEAIQQNEGANQEAIFLGRVTALVNERIDRGEIMIVGNTLVGRFVDSLTFEM